MDSFTFQIRFRESSLNNGVSVSTIREIRFLKCTDHPNIVKLHKIVSPDGIPFVLFVNLVTMSMKYSELQPICLIMDYVDHDMWGLLQFARESKLALWGECVRSYA